MTDEKIPRPGSASPLLTDTSVSMAIRLARFEAFGEAIEVAKEHGAIDTARAIEELRSAAKPRPSEVSPCGFTWTTPGAVSVCDLPAGHDSYHSCDRPRRESPKTSGTSDHPVAYAGLPEAADPSRHSMQSSTPAGGPEEAGTPHDQVAGASPAGSFGSRERGESSGVPGPKACKAPPHPWPVFEVGDTIDYGGPYVVLAVREEDGALNIERGQTVRWVHPAVVRLVSKGRPPANEFGEHKRTDERLRALVGRFDRIENRLDSHIDDEDRHMPGTIEAADSVGAEEKKR